MNKTIIIDAVQVGKNSQENSTSIQLQCPQKNRLDLLYKLDYAQTWKQV